MTDERLRSRSFSPIRVGFVKPRLELIRMTRLADFESLEAQRF